MKKITRSSRYLILPLVAFLLTLSPSLFADGGPQHQVLTDNYGVSGGNINDRSRRFCCSGTLGALVKDNNNVQYILSNNHVLARSDQGTVGEDVSQPGLIDNNCATPRIVGDLVNWPRLGSNVDAAMAQLRSGTMRTDGFILDIGIPCSTPATPAVGMSVAKSGRTTGFTTGSVQSVNTSVSVQYAAQCGGGGKKSTISYTNQVVITPGTFSAGGDSGSLIVTNDSNHQPVGLLFAGSSSATIANPIGQVLTQVSTALGGGRTVSFVGNNCSTSLASAGPVSDQQGPSNDAVEFATMSMRGREQDIMSRAGVIGMGIGTADENTGEAVIVVFVNVNSKASPRLPRRINGVRVKRVMTDPFVAF